MIRILTMATALIGLSGPALAGTIAMIGTGDVGSALGIRFAEQGHIIVYGSRTPNDPAVETLVRETGNGARATTQAESVEGADIVVLAIPWAPAQSIVESLGPLDGKIIIDPINARSFGANRTISLAAEPSAAELIQSWAPNAHVVKAYNTLTRAFMVDPTASGGPITIPIAGNNQNAKAKVAELTRGIGLEAMGLIYVAQGFQGRDRFEFHFRPR